MSWNKKMSAASKFGQFAPVWRSRAFLLLAGATLTSCVSLDGQQKSTISSKRLFSDYPAYLFADVVTPFYLPESSASTPVADSKDGPTACQTAFPRHCMDRQSWRNAVIDARMHVADVRYGEFTRQITGQRHAFTLATGLTALGLTSGAAVAAKETANALSAGGSGVTGLGAAVDKELFAAETMQVFIAQMDANRATIRGRLDKGRQQSANDYPIGEALSDLSDYEQAASLQRAIVKAAADASAAKSNADAAVAKVQFTYSYDADSKKIGDYWLPSGVKSSANEGKINGCITQLSLNDANGTPMSIPEVINGEASSNQKKALISCLNI